MPRRGARAAGVAKPVLAPIKSTTDAGGYTVTAAERPSGAEGAAAKRETVPAARRRRPHSAGRRRARG